VPLRDFLVGQSARLQLASLLSTIRYCDLIYNGAHADWTIDENEPLVCRLSRHLYSGTNTLAGYEEIKRHSTFDHMSADTSQRQGTSLPHNHRQHTWPVFYNLLDAKVILIPLTRVAHGPRPLVAEVPLPLFFRGFVWFSAGSLWFILLVFFMVFSVLLVWIFFLNFLKSTFLDFNFFKVSTNFEFE
jgi:hypothetical protein